MTHPHRWAGAILLLVLTWVAWFDVRPAVQAYGRVPAQVAVLTAAAERLPGQVLPVVQAEVRSGVDGALAVVKQSLATADGRLQSIQEQADRTVKESLTVADRHLAGIRSEIRPSLDASAALLSDVKDSMDDLYWDVKASVASATVATTSVARAAETANAALPKFLALGEAIGHNVEGVTGDVHGITTDVHKVTSKFTAPRTKKQKAWDAVQFVLLLGARARFR